MAIVGATPPLRSVLLFISQILGAISSAAIVSCLFPGPLNVQTSLAAGTSIAQGLFIEMFLTAELVFTMFTRVLDPLRVILGIRHAAGIDFVLAGVGRLVLEDLDELVETGGNEGTEDGTEPVDPVVAHERTRHDGRTK